MTRKAGTGSMGAVGQAALDRAFDDKSLMLVYQAIHETRTRAVVAAEALLRQRRQSGEIREAQVIAKAAEKGPDVFALDSWSVVTACRDAVRWQRGAPDVRLNVNLSPRELQQPGVVDRISGLVAGCGISPASVNLEITEVSYIEHPESITPILHELKSLGLSLWLDDFGTRHSSITHLHQFPVDGIKLPGEFVVDLPHDERSRAIVKGLIAIAHDLGIRVTAEGVETDQQLDYLREAGCDFIQGFLFSMPMLASDFERYVASTGAN